MSSSGLQKAATLHIYSPAKKLFNLLFSIILWNVSHEEIALLLRHLEPQ